MRAPKIWGDSLALRALGVRVDDRERDSLDHGLALREAAGALIRGESVAVRRGQFPGHLCGVGAEWQWVEGSEADGVGRLLAGRSRQLAGPELVVAGERPVALIGRSRVHGVFDGRQLAAEIVDGG